MKKYFLFSLAFFLYTILLAQTPSTDPHWQLKWNDEFNYNAASTGANIQAMRNKWHFVEGWGNTRDSIGYDMVTHKKIFGYHDLYADDSDVTIEFNNGTTSVLILVKHFQLVTNWFL